MCVLLVNNKNNEEGEKGQRDHFVSHPSEFCELLTIFCYLFECCSIDHLEIKLSEVLGLHWSLLAGVMPPSVSLANLIVFLTGNLGRAPPGLIFADPPMVGFDI